VDVLCAAEILRTVHDVEHRLTLPRDSRNASWVVSHGVTLPNLDLDRLKRGSAVYTLWRRLLTMAGPKRRATT
jgi:hypothetical protein